MADPVVDADQTTATGAELRATGHDFSTVWTLPWITQARIGQQAYLRTTRRQQTR
jgi:hypothetical protein